MASGSLKPIGIEALLTWAYRDELPKHDVARIAVTSGGGMQTGAGVVDGGWDAISRQGELMTELVSDGRVNAYGVVPIGVDCGPPHPDAYAVHEAASALDRWEIGLPEGWCPLADMHLNQRDSAEAMERAMPRIVITGSDGKPRYRQRPAELVRHHAIMKSAPDWEALSPVARFVNGPKGKPAWFRMVTITEGRTTTTMEVSGYNERSQRPFPGAYKKTMLDPDPALAAIDRAEYEIWFAALGLITETLSLPGVLTGHVALPCTRPARPWEAGL